MRNMDKQREIVVAALKWLDTPYHHHARICGVGVDCAQFVVAVAKDVQLVDDQFDDGVPDYPVQWHLHNREEKLLNLLEEFGCKEVDKSETQAGDIVCFKFGRVTSHLGIAINENEFIHARYDIGKVVINTFQQEWDRNWTKTYTFPGVLNG